jgi:uncharacterized protein YcbK (DUF882 family)
MKYFTIEELCQSDVATAQKIANKPTGEQADNMVKLIERVLDPLREAWGKPIIVNSGFRSAALNHAVGGAMKSEHLEGRAADITTGTKGGNKQLFELAKKLNLPFRQLIDEKNFSWVHISYDENDIKRQVLSL